MADWLKEAGCTHVALESTGVYWKPIFNILEADFEVVLVNAKHIKLSSVATDVMGKSGWDMVGAIIDGEQDPQKLAALARGRLKTKREQLEQALHGRVTDLHRFLLAQHRAHIEFLDRMIADYDRRIDEQVQPFFALIPLLDRVPGINEVTAKAIIAEIGTDMDQFPAAAARLQRGGHRHAPCGVNSISYEATGRPGSWGSRPVL